MSVTTIKLQLRIRLMSMIVDADMRSPKRMKEILKKGHIGYNRMDLDELVAVYKRHYGMDDIVRTTREVIRQYGV